MSDAVKGQTLRAIIEAFAPPKTAMEGDRVGLQVGTWDKDVRRVLISLDTTLEVAEEAARLEADLIISHHAVIFRPLSDLRVDRPRGRLLELLIKKDIAVYVPHTAMDIARGGINDHLADRFGLVDVSPLRELGEDLVDGRLEPRGIGRLGRLAEPTELAALGDRVLQVLGAPFLRRVGDPQRRIEKVAVLCGDGNRFLADADRRGADVLITGDVYYHTALEARSRGLALLDPGHNATERVAGALWREVILKGLREAKQPAIEVLPSVTNTEPFRLQTPGEKA